RLVLDAVCAENAVKFFSSDFSDYSLDAGFPGCTMKNLYALVTLGKLVCILRIGLASAQFLRTSFLKQRGPFCPRFGQYPRWQPPAGVSDRPAWRGLNLVLLHPSFPGREPAVGTNPGRKRGTSLCRYTPGCVSWPLAPPGKRFGANTPQNPSNGSWSSWK